MINAMDEEILQMDKKYEEDLKQVEEYFAEVIGRAKMENMKKIDGELKPLPPPLKVNLPNNNRHRHRRRSTTELNNRSSRGDERGRSKRRNCVVGRIIIQQE